MVLLSEPNILVEIGVIIIAATIGGFTARAFKQPLIPSYIIVGVLLGPIFHLITDAKNMWLLSEIGVAFLLFLVGLEFDFSKLRDVGTVSTIGGLLQAALMFAIGFGASLLLGYNAIVGVHLGLMMSFSSTMVVVKLLSDRQEVESLHGRIIIGILLLQDVVAILALTLLADPAESGMGNAWLSLGLGVLIIVASFVIGRKFAPPLFKSAARNLELLFLLAVSMCLGYALLFAMFGFSIAIGAFIAGIILGNLPYHIEIASRVKPLKDFFTVIFFTSIGLQLHLTEFTQALPAFFVFFFLTIVISPLLTMIICMLFGYKKRVAFLTGLTLSQVSEFALIVAFAGVSNGLIDNEVYGLILILTVVSIAMSAYFIKYEEKLYALLGRFLDIFERFGLANKELEHLGDDHKHEVVLIGLNRTGYAVFRKLQELKKDFLVIELNPDVIHRLIQRHIPCIYGDIGDPEVLGKLKLDQVKLVISTINNHEVNLLLLQRLKREHSHARVIVTSYDAEDALDLYEAGADYVIIPHILGGHHVSLMLEDFSTDLDKLIMTKLDHIDELKRRRELNYHLPRR
ncbi:hypothetical protein D6789_02530 [Candidatus Woesearchaeota archaeon]|nr:MAG: hypothetical protein D6789_02530 [Candidatus Woesearchaeota archaeon]